MDCALCGVTGLPCWAIRGTCQSAVQNPASKAHPTRQKTCSSGCRYRLKRSHDKPRKQDPAYGKEWRQRPEVIERRREYNRQWMAFNGPRFKTLEQRKRDRERHRQRKVMERAALRVLQDLGIKL